MILSSANFKTIYSVTVFCLLIKASLNNDTRKKETQQNIAYGGILNTYEENILPNDTNVLHVSQFAVNFIRDRYPAAVPPVIGDNEPLQYNIKDITKLNLVFTMDGLKPYLVEIMSETLEMHPHSLIWGSTYKFKIIWFNENIGYHHSFTVTQYWDETLYIYQHTVYEVHEAAEVNYLSSDMKRTLQHPINVPIYQEDLSGSVDVDINKASHQPSNYRDHSNHDPPSHSTDPSNSMDTCSKKSFDNIELKQETLTVHSRLLKILSFNIWNTNVVQGGYKQYLSRIKQIAKLCRDSDADVIGFQEVRFEDGKGGRQGPNQVEHLAKILKKYQFVYQPAQIQTSNLPKRVEEGVAFFSKYPIIDHDYLLLTRDYGDLADGHQRILLHVEVDVPHIGSIHLFNTHLSLSHVARQRTVKEIWWYMNQFSGAAFLMGDFNAEAHNKEVKYLDGREDINGEKTSGLYDTWLMQYGSSNPGFTFNTLEDTLTKRIDLIFMRKVPNVHLHSISLLDDGKRREQAASDHLGLLAVFNMTHPNSAL